MIDFEFQEPEAIQNAQEVCGSFLKQNGSNEAKGVLRVIEDVIKELKWRQNIAIDAETSNRNEIAKAAMPAIAGHWTLIQGTFSASEEDLIKIRERIAQGAYAIADALIKEGRK